ncbi:hypothetical protein PIB30_014764 [Stylosanthes scabra]|uniref:Uncharacterized protein n=1 Tax=Stylosanthes scabra TaxID=79078 RepID=A0ABU6Y6A9_9FABA|nr:hypothetical protein [Stylosanthes scabra]
MTKYRVRGIVHEQHAPKLHNMNIWIPDTFRGHQNGRQDVKVSEMGSNLFCYVFFIVNGIIVVRISRIVIVVICTVTTIAIITAFTSVIVILTISKLLEFFLHASVVGFESSDYGHYLSKGWVVWWTS